VVNRKFIIFFLKLNRMNLELLGRLEQNNIKMDLKNLFGTHIVVSI